MDYPGRIIKIGESNSSIVSHIAGGLVGRGYASLSPPGVYDRKFKSVVELFQAQNVDASRRPLRVDGEVGPLTWGALFGAVPISVAPTGIAGAALGVAISQIGVMESPLGSNSGPQVDQYLASVNLGPGYYWCMAFIYWCFREAATSTSAANPFPKTAGCIDAWNKVKAKSPRRIITKAQALANPALVRPGHVFILDYGGGMGHTGFVRHSVGGALKTVEGNTNATGSNNGLGVFELNRRNVADGKLRGFIDFT